MLVVCENTPATQPACKRPRKGQCYRSHKAFISSRLATHRYGFIEIYFIISSFPSKTRARSLLTRQLLFFVSAGETTQQRLVATFAKASQLQLPLHSLVLALRFFFLFLRNKQPKECLYTSSDVLDDDDDHCWCRSRTVQSVAHTHTHGHTKQFRRRGTHHDGGSGEKPGVADAAEQNRFPRAA